MGLILSRIQSGYSQNSIPPTIERPYEYQTGISDDPQTLAVSDYPVERR